MKPPYAVVDTSAPPDEVRDETLAIAPGATRYWLMLDDAEVENLADGVVSEAVARRAFGCLQWKREAGRVEARQQPRRSRRLPLDPPQDGG